MILLHIERSNADVNRNAPEAIVKACAGREQCCTRNLGQIFRDSWLPWTEADMVVLRRSACDVHDADVV